MLKKYSIHEIKEFLTDNYESITTSYHEAGHVVYGLLFLIKITDVCLIKEERIGGNTNYMQISNSVSNKFLAKKIARNEVGLIYAGHLAERLHYKKVSGVNKLPFIIKNGSWVDTKDAYRVIKKHSLNKNKSIIKYKNYLQYKISKILDFFWEDITIVATNLFKRKKLSFNDLRKALLKSSKKDFWKLQFKQINNIYGDDFFIEAILVQSLRNNQTNILLESSK